MQELLHGITIAHLFPDQSSLLSKTCGVILDVITKIQKLSVYSGQHGRDSMDSWDQQFKVPVVTGNRSVSGERWMRLRSDLLKSGRQSIYRPL